MARAPRGCFAVRAAAALLLVGGFLLPASWAQDGRLQLGPLSPYDLENDRRVKVFTVMVESISEKASRATTELELDAFTLKLEQEMQQGIAAFRNAMGNALNRWTAFHKAVVDNEQRVKALTVAIEAERARIAAPPPSQEEGALDGVIAQTKTELADLEGRQARVPMLEAQLQAMPVEGFMNAAPRERLQADLAAARANLPAPGAIAKTKADLAKYEAELTRLRGTRATPSDGELTRLRQQLKAVEAAIQVDLPRAEEAKATFIRVRAQALGFVELWQWITALVDGRRQALRAGTGVPSALVQCATMQGPFRCTGAFDGSWSSTCTTGNYNGPAKVTFGPDGWVEVRMTNASPKQGDTPTIVGGKISPDGKVYIERNYPSQIEIYRGQFNLVTSTLASGAARPTGGGTYETTAKDSKGAITFRCSGTMKLH